jgi:hypothetical protein
VRLQWFTFFLQFIFATSILIQKPIIFILHNKFSKHTQQSKLKSQLKNQKHRSTLHTTQKNWNPKKLFSSKITSKNPPYTQQGFAGNGGGLKRVKPSGFCELCFWLVVDRLIFFVGRELQWRNCFWVVDHQNRLWVFH